MGALITRAIFIALGSIILSNFSWVMLVMGLFLLYTGVKIAFVNEDDSNPENNFFFKLSNKFMNISKDFDGSKFRTTVDGVKFLLQCF